MFAEVEPPAELLHVATKWEIVVREDNKEATKNWEGWRMSIRVMIMMLDVLLWWNLGPKCSRGEGMLVLILY